MIQQSTDWIVALCHRFFFLSFFYSLASWQSFPEAADFDVAMEAILAEEMQNLKRMSRLQVPLASH